jgi:hypothetical protein
MPVLLGASYHAYVSRLKQEMVIRWSEINAPSFDLRMILRMNRWEWSRTAQDSW